MPNRSFLYFCFAVIGLVLTAAASFGASPSFKAYGDIRPSAEATRIFESHRVLPNYKYYFSGGDLYPDAIIGIDKSYTLETELWKEIELTPKKLKEIQEDMHKKSLDVGEILHGFDIVDNRGKKIGIWYSILRARTSVRMLEDNRVMIFTPTLNVWEHGDGSLFRQMPR